jgi:hypothetical protein
LAEGREMMINESLTENCYIHSFIELVSHFVC